ncbi:MAG TPA: L-rhamnose mutarotase [Ktedonobacteraceae bacterium]|nr:L-rhamnose mutarotase [Ktedonobacteraceae bacterium]
MKRYGQLIGVKSDQIAAYEHIHEHVWPEVLAMIEACHMRNYTIFRYGTLLFAYFEYIGDDYAADMARMAADPKTREWWSHTDPMQEPVAGGAEGEWWTVLREVFHTD